MLLIECPRLLFPFARRLVADLTQEGGFPPLRIDPVDFTALYRQQRARAQQPATNGGGAAAAPAPNVETGAADAPAGEPENKDNEK